MTETANDQLVRIEAYDRGVATFCLYAVWNAQPTTAEAQAAKERLLDSIAPENNWSGYQCPVEGCNNQNYPKNPDYKSDEDTERHGEVYRPVDIEGCRFKGFCLREAFAVGEDIEHKPLRDAVRIGAYNYYTNECGLVTGSSFPGGNRCVAPNCCLSAGFSEDGVGGTVGECVRQVEQ